MSVCDLGSGCGLTGNTFAKFGCTVVGFEPGKKSVDIAKEYAKKIGVSSNVKYIHGYTNDLIGDQIFDRLHTGYMLNEKNAMKYVKNNLKKGGIAVMNVGGYNNGAVFIYRKD